MVICASCKAYTDDQKSHCEQCGVELLVDQKEHLVLQAHHPELARLVEDQVHAQLVASAVVITHHTDFFYASEGHQTVLAKLFGSGRDPRMVTAGVLFSAYAYLSQTGYCAVRVRGVKEGEQSTSVARLRPWDGQKSVEGALAEQMERAFTTREATEKTLRELMHFRLMSVHEGSFLQAPKARNAPDRSAFAAIDQLARVTTLPERDPVDACRATYRLLAAFVDQDPDRARLLASEMVFVLREFESYT
jgi:RNA polymerase subunit RPABC4/transcription elongation factor Spt4